MIKKTLLAFGLFFLITSISHAGEIQGNFICKINYGDDSIGDIALRIEGTELDEKNLDYGTVTGYSQTYVGRLFQVYNSNGATHLILLSETDSEREINIVTYSMMHAYQPEPILGKGKCKRSF